ncbi:hypothetical protein ACIRU8_39175 [Streptomyces sp. NPDC101175]|uniref:hypothetical protein n=1 Tax=Streptomyces sp. NPDC101175 TaxID=3366123 RepID=UPI0038372E98
MTVDRQLNACGFSIETIAAEYETDAALVEWPDSPSTFPPDGHYFHAAFRAEDEQRQFDYATAATTKEA